jgi:DNA-binding SARP family transcriptional activator
MKACYNRHMPDFRILGPLEVSDEAGPLLLGGQKQRAVLAVLLLEPGRVVSVDRLIDALWGENPPRTATTSLQNFISQLRKTLGPEVLETKPPGYRLRIRPGELDLDRFRVLVESARAAEPLERAEKLRHALALWRGPALADFTFEAFAQPHIAHLEELRLGTLEERVQADLDSGAHAELIGELEVLVDEFPLRERLRGQYMLALYRAGRQAEALQAYQEGRRILVDQLGIEPSRELQQLHGAILTSRS